jgi:2,4-dienoyl-CoA reductase-like NADH-dependent reductase (Old Yellow Enzyme family)
MPTKSYPHLFKPLTSGGLRLKNRITMAEKVSNASIRQMNHFLFASL